jgi:hypothetical protein
MDHSTSARSAAAYMSRRTLTRLDSRLYSIRVLLGMAWATAVGYKLPVHEHIRHVAEHVQPCVLVQSVLAGA